MRNAVNQASNAAGTAASTGATLGGEAQGIGANLTPFLTEEMLHPQGIGQTGLAAETAAAEGGAGPPQTPEYRFPSLPFGPGRKRPANRFNPPSPSVTPLHTSRSTGPHPPPLFRSGPKRIGRQLQPDYY